MEKDSKADIELPPGFRFYPSDEELILHYLIKKATSHLLPAPIVAEVELYKFNPWELPKKALYGEEEWYFFTPRDRKYPNGMRPNRMAGSGYWKATGTDKPIFPSSPSCGGKMIGVKKALVFYVGRPPRGNKTDWIMHEYRLPESTILTSKRKGSMRLDDWVLCRVRQKSSIRECTPAAGGGGGGIYHRRQSSESHPNSVVETASDMAIMDSLLKDCPMLPFLIGSQELPTAYASTTKSFEKSRNSSSTVSVCQENSDHGDYSPWSSTLPNLQEKSVEDTDDHVTHIQPNGDYISFGGIIQPPSMEAMDMFSRSDFNNVNQWEYSLL